jgi:IMP cyclohydrolase
VDPQLDLAKLRRKVELEIDEYVYEVPQDSIGNPWSADKVEQQLQAFRDALVDPYWIDVVDDDKKRKRCAAVADDKKSYLLVFEPDAQKFMLVMKKGSDLISFGVDGDPVGCFFAR